MGIAFPAVQIGGRGMWEEEEDGWKKSKLLKQLHVIFEHSPRF